MEHEPVRYDPTMRNTWCSVCGRSIIGSTTGDRHQSTAKAKIERRMARIAEEGQTR